MTFEFNCEPYWLPGKLMDLLPDIYRDNDILNPQYLLDVGYGKEGQFERYLHVFEQELDRTKCLVDHMTKLVDIDSCPCYIIPYLARLVGLEPNYDLSCDDQRREVKSIVEVYKRKGTIPGIIDLCRTFTDFKVQVVEFYKNLFIYNKLDRTYLGPYNDDHLGEVLLDTSHRYYSPRDDFYQRSALGLVLTANHCDDSLINTRLKKLKRVLNLYIPEASVAFIIVQWKCKMTLDFVSGAEVRTNMIMKFLNQTGPYWARHWLEYNKLWKKYNDPKYFYAGPGPYINRFEELVILAETIYETVAPTLPPTVTNSEFSGFANFNPFIMQYHYFDSIAYGKVDEYDPVTKQWNNMRTHDQPTQGLFNVDSALFSLTDYWDGFYTDVSARYTEIDGWQLIGGDSPGSYGGNTLIFKDGSTWYLTAYRYGGILYSAPNWNGPWLQISGLTSSGNPLIPPVFIESERKIISVDLNDKIYTYHLDTGYQEMANPFSNSGYYKKCKVIDGRILFLGGNPGDAAVIHEFDSTNLNINEDHSYKIPNPYDDLVLVDIEKKDDQFIIIGYTEGWERWANIIFSCDLDFTNWQMLHLIPLNYEQRYSRVSGITTDSIDNKVVVGYDNPIQATRYESFASLELPDVQSINLENSLQFDSVSLNAEIQSFITFNSDQYLVYNYEDTVDKAKVVKRVATDSWSSVLEKDTKFYDLNIVNSELYLGSRYYHKTDTENWLDGPYKFNGSSWVEIDAQHYTEDYGGSENPHYGHVNFFSETNGSYWSFAMEGHASFDESVLYSGSTPDNYNVYPNYSWQSIDYYRFRNPLLFDNKVYFLTGEVDEKLRKILEFDGVDITEHDFNAYNSNFISLRNIGGRLIAFGDKHNIEDYRVLVLDVTDPTNPIDYSHYISYQFANKLILTDGVQVGSDIFIIGYDNDTKENVILITKDKIKYTELYREAQQIINSQYRFIIFDGTDILIGVGKYSGVMIKRFSLTY